MKKSKKAVAATTPDATTRAASVATPDTLKRADTHATPATLEQAVALTTSDTDAPATDPTSSDDHARAAADESSEVDTRADESVIPEPVKRAETIATSGRKKRAKADATPRVDTRAVANTPPEREERAATRATPGTKARAISTTTPVPLARAASDVTTEEEKRAGIPATPAAVTRTPEQDRLALKKKVRMFYDIQRLRLQCAGRTYDRPDGVSIHLHEIDVVILEGRAKELERAEKNALHDVSDHLKSMPFFVKVLSDKTRYRGIGPTMAGVILSEFDIRRQETPSQMWAFAGLRPMPATRCKACHEVLIELDYEGRKSFKHRTKCAKDAAPVVYGPLFVYESGQAQRPTKGEKLPYNAWLRTKLVGVLADVMIKLNSPWRKFYDDYKHRKTSAGWGRSDGHRHQAAKRYMIKMLLADIWKEWRTFENLPVRPSYQEQYLGHTHHPNAVAQREAAEEFLENAHEIEAELSYHDELVIP